MKRILNIALGGLILLLGLFFALAGGKLALLGGSPYYIITGLVLLASGACMVASRPIGRWLYMLAWIGTALWAVWEAGFHFFPLIPRLGLMTGLLAAVILMELRDRPARKAPSAIILTATGSVAAVGLFSLCLAGGTKPDTYPVPEINPPSEAVPTNEADNDWQDYGGTLSGRRYSSLADITPANVARLQPAWVQRTGDIPSAAEVDGHIHEVHSEATPIHVGHTLYTCTPHSSVQAIDDTTGKTLWTWQDKARRPGNPYLVCRGVSYYEAPEGTPCRQRLFAPTSDAHIVALDARTGALCLGFGDNGQVDLHANMGETTTPTQQVSTSPPTVLNNRLIIGERIDDGVNRLIQSGAVLAYDAVSGKLAWAWDVGRSPNAIPPLPAGEHYTPGTPNVWGTITADARNGLLYMGTGNASPDYYTGMRRPFDEKFGDSIIALDVGTGRLVWQRQLVHDDMWDMDIPVGPSLFDYKAPDGTIIPALIQTTKMGQVYFLNRLTGEPISPIREIPVPTKGAVEGVKVSPTQPFSVGMPSFTPAPPREDTTWGATPIDQLLCRIDLRETQGAGPFQPVGLKPVIGHPAFNGITDWGGAAIDPERGIMTVNMMEVPFKMWLARRDTPEARELMKNRRPGENATNTLVAPQFNTPYIGMVKAWIGLFGAPCLQPSWGALAAIDLHTRKLIWKKDLGTARDTGLFGTRLGIPLKIGVPNIGGSMVTAGGVAFIGATTDQYLRAFDVKTGKELWKARLPAGAQATPMTYRGADGRQYVVITAGGHGALGTRFGDYTYAFALPHE